MEEDDDDDDENNDILKNVFSFARQHIVSPLRK
jgi:hypothetical protein